MSWWIMINDDEWYDEITLINETNNKKESSLRTTKKDMWNC